MSQSYTPTSIEVQLLDFDHLNPATSHIMIHVDVGKMPPRRISKYLDNVRQQFGLCKQLEKAGFKYSLIAKQGDGRPVTVNETVPSTLPENPKDQESLEKEAMNMVRECMDIGFDECDYDRKVTLFRDALTFMKRNGVSLGVDLWKEIMTDTLLEKVAKNFADEMYGSEGLDDVMVDGWRSRDYMGRSMTTSSEFSVTGDASIAFDDSMGVLD